MKTSLLETYKNRMILAEQAYASKHPGQKLDNYKKLVTARLLENTSKFLTENYAHSVGMQRQNLGQFKVFAMNLANVVVPNLIAHELVLVSPMSSWTGNVTFLNYVAGSDKGGVRRGDLFNGVYGLGKMTEDRMNYTGEKVVEWIPEGEKFMTLAWTPVVDSIRVMTMAGEDVDFEVVDADQLQMLFDKRLNPFHADEENGAHQGALADPDRQLDADIEYKYPAEEQKYGWRGGFGTVAAGDKEKKLAIVLDQAVAGKLKVSYIYENTVIPQDDLPLLSAYLDSVSLKARARRIAIVFSQIAAYQAQQDYGMNLGDLLAEQAVGELAYEIDSEIVAGLVDAAPLDGDLIWRRNGRLGLSIQEQYGSFAEVIEIAKAKIFKATQKFSPNFMIIAPDVLPVLSFAPQFTPAPATNVAGPYVAGTLNNIKIVVSPMVPDGQFVIGVNGSDMRTAAAVYAPYMPIVPTQLLMGPDGTETQGFSTLYDFQILSKLPAGYAEDGFKFSPAEYDEEGNVTKKESVKIIPGGGRKASADRPFSPLLVKGAVVGSRF